MKKIPEHIEQDENLKIIKEKILEIAPNSKIILFGSRADGSNREDSDYDLLVNLYKNTDLSEKRKIATSIRKKLASALIDADIVVRDTKEINDYSSIEGCVTFNALNSGMLL
jgi:predicted nucleotidyltransferase